MPNARMCDMIINGLHNLLTVDLHLDTETRIWLEHHMRFDILIADLSKTDVLCRCFQLHTYTKHHKYLYSNNISSTTPSQYCICD